MNLSHTSYTIAEIRDQLLRKDLVVNPDYQRSSDIWPSNAQSYFIDTILEGYPFPKVYFYESYDEKKLEQLHSNSAIDVLPRLRHKKRYENSKTPL